jgi:pSer/pThr/pTyr-binding forkhead associated (FHA) protein
MAVKLSISITEGPEKGMSFEFHSGPVLLGRGRGDIPLSDKKTSSKHCQFHIEGDRIWLEDLNSTNGTFVGSNRLTERVALNNLDVVTVGLSRLSIAIVEDLGDFKARNSNDLSTSSATVSELDAGEEPEDLIESNLNFFEDQEAPKAAEPELELEDEVDLIEASLSTPKGPSPIELPSEDAQYRETGVQRIDHLIDDEIQSFSKWDHPAMKDTEAPRTGAMPKIDLRLIKRKGPANFQELKCQKNHTSFGRKDVDVRINDLDLSRKHAAVELINGEKAYVRDLASTNGTFVNGQRVSHQELSNGDLIQIGQNIFEVVIREAE